MNQVLHQIQQDVALMLQQDDVFKHLVEAFTVTARVKEPYSMWRKMLKNNYKHILQVPDALALRIVLDAKKLTPDEPVETTRARETSLCYYAQRLCTEMCKPVPGNPRFKDYIEAPKQNGYQSLHYTTETVQNGQDWTCEIQVRSGEMHQVAEFGLASHWDYKLASTTVHFEQGGREIDHSFGSYLRNVQEWKGSANTVYQPWDASPTSSETLMGSDIWQSRRRVDRIRERTKRMEPYLKSLTAAQLDLAREHLFVFVDAKVVALPAGACVLDALRKANSSFEQEIRLNGAATSETRLLHNGDVLDFAKQAVVSA
jgi:(p)ppGpp synthase/HD superfamily hydrolase